MFWGNRLTFLSQYMLFCTQYILFSELIKGPYVQWFSHPLVLMVVWVYNLNLFELITINLVPFSKSVVTQPLWIEILSKVHMLGSVSIQLEERPEWLWYRGRGNHCPRLRMCKQRNLKYLPENRLRASTSGALAKCGLCAVGKCGAGNSTGH